MDIKPIKLCSKCGVEIVKDTEEICQYCKEQLKRKKKYHDCNAQIYKDNRCADKLGLSYGVYKANEQVWLKKIREEQWHESKKLQ